MLRIFDSFLFYLGQKPTNLGAWGQALPRRDLVENCHAFQTGDRLSLIMSTSWWMTRIGSPFPSTDPIFSWSFLTEFADMTSSVGWGLVKRKHFGIGNPGVTSSLFIQGSRFVWFKVYLKMFVKWAVYSDLGIFGKMLPHKNNIHIFSL